MPGAPSEVTSSGSFSPRIFISSNAAEEHPVKFLQIVAALIPQHFKVENDHTLNLSADELRSKLLEIRAKLLDSDVDPELLGPPREGNVGRE
jgi:hypothetical protein